MTDENRNVEDAPKDDQDVRIEDLEIKDAEDAESVTGGAFTELKPIKTD